MIVLTEKDNRRFEYAGEVEAFMEIPLGGCSVAEKVRTTLSSPRYRAAHPNPNP